MCVHAMLMLHNVFLKACSLTQTHTSINIYIYEYTTVSERTLKTGSHWGEDDEDEEEEEEDEDDDPRVGRVLRHPDNCVVT